MPKPIRTADAEAALRQILRENVEAARGDNALISRTEAKALDPFLQKADEALRIEGGAGTRVHADALVDKAAQAARQVWERFNPSGTRDGLYLAQDEVARVKAEDPALGALTELALLRVRGRGADPTTAVQAFFDGVDFSTRPMALPGFARVEARVGDAGRAGVPAAVREAFDFFYRVEDKDIGGVSLQRGTIAGTPVWAVVTTTDGDDAYLEVRKADGTLIAGARAEGADIFAWDEFPGRVRLSKLFTSTLHTVVPEDGMSDDVERARLGQPPQDWPGQLKLATGVVHHKDIDQFLGVDMPAGTSAELRDVAIAAFETLWEGMKMRLAPGDSFELGPLREGVMVVGEYTRPTTGKTYLVADWRDIDDGSYVLYFERTAQGPQLAISQFDN